jgi:DNA-binding GntR family transcriptional regulator
MEAIDETDSRSLQQIAYERLRNAVGRCELQPGDFLSEVRISRALGISRTPVREAIRRLAQEGLLEVIPGRAITVAAPSIQEMLDALHVRDLLEPELARLAAETFPDNGKRRLEETIRQMEQAAQVGDRLGWSSADTVWHEMLGAACPNQFLSQLVLLARNRMVSVAFEDTFSVSNLVRGTREHKAITEAIVTSDGETAETLMREHLQKVRHSLFERY